MMLKQFLQNVKTSHLRALQEQKGQSLIIFTFALLGLIAMMGLALDLGLVYIEQVRVGRTTDAATLAAVVELPSEEEAIKRAIEFIELNGYDVNGPNADTRILVRGCVSSLAVEEFGTGTSLPPGNVSELSVPGGSPVHAPHGAVITPTTEITGAVVAAFNPPDPRATFMIDTYSYQPAAPDPVLCDSSANENGSAQKIQVRGEVNVRMNFMQFFGFGEVPVADVALAENITNLDVMVVFDVSGSMEYETTCYDCWVRTDIDNHVYPDNGYYNPLPFDSDLKATDQSIPASDLCTQPPTALTDGTYNYLSHEAELYSRNVGDWRFSRRRQGQGFWVIQRGSRSDDEKAEYNDYHDDPEGKDDWQGNQAGNPAEQSSNVCNPGIAGNGIDCDLSPSDNICDDDGTVSRDCSAYIKAHPYPSYSQGAATSDPKAQGGAYNLECFTGPLKCWASSYSDDDPFRPSNNLAPFPRVEYDFTPRWSGSTSIWIRALGGGDRAIAWQGTAPPPSATLTDWKRAVYWEVPGVTAQVEEDLEAPAFNGGGDNWRANRAVENNWKWIRLGEISTTEDMSYTLRIYQGSAGYAIDKVVFTDYDGTDTPDFLKANNKKGPPATDGSATRESCNKCNPAFGYTVDPADCTCPGGVLGEDCTEVAEPDTNQRTDDLYRGIEPLRSAQEAVKNFAKRLDTDFDQVGIVSFGTDLVPIGPRGTKLQCQRDDPNNCDNSEERFLEVLKATERQWPQVSTNISAGLREGLVQLGVSPYSDDTDCNPGNPDSSCARPGARKILILLTDGSPNEKASECSSEKSGDFWNGTVGNGDPDYECSAYYAAQAAQNGVIVYTIGLGAGINSDFLTLLAEGHDPSQPAAAPEFSGRGGKFFNAATPKDLETIFTEILGNIYVRIR